MISRVYSILLVSLLLSITPLLADDNRPASFMRGVTISCHGSGPGEWDSPEMGKTMKELKTLGANWISFHPYARIHNDGSLSFRQMPDDPIIFQPLADAKSLDVKVMLIPHIAYWGSQFNWRGDITFDTEEKWSRFFGDYAKFIVHQATLAQQAGVDLLCIGIEYRLTTHREAQWRDIIARVRQVYTGPIVYAANWDNYMNVPFWDAVDYIGVQAYFPLTDAPNPSEETLNAGWDRHLKTLCQFAEKLDKPIIFTELGYAHSELAAVEPWSARSTGENGLQNKLRCMKIALSRIEHEPHIQGVFLWKWFVDREHPRRRQYHRHRDPKGNFNLQFPEMESLIQAAWSTPPSVTSNPVLKH